MKRGLFLVGVPVLVLILTFYFADSFHRDVSIAPREALISNLGIARATSSAVASAAPGSTTILFAGDVMLGRYVETLMKAKGDSYPFKNIHDLLQEPDAVVVNLEGPIHNDHVQSAIDSYRFSFRSSTADILKTAGVTHVTLANNHTSDFGMLGLRETRAYLASSGIMSFGAPMGAATATIATDTIAGRAVAFAGFNATYALSASSAAAAVARIRGAEPDAFLAVMMHWGDEYSLTANAYQKKLAHALVGAGADAVFGAHPHVIEPIELVDGHPIFYSLGNLIFDQYFATDTQRGLVVQVHLDGAERTYELIPVVSVRSMPHAATGTMRDDMLRRIASSSDPALREMITAGELR